MKQKCTDDRELQNLLHSMEDRNPTPDRAPIDLSSWKKWLWLVLILGALALGWRWWSGGGEEQKIRRPFAELSSAVGKSGGAASNLSILTTTDDLKDLFADPVTLQVSGDEDFGLAGTYSEAELKSNITRMRSVFKTLKVSFSDIKIRARNSTTATVDATVRAIATVEGSKADEVRLLTCQMVKKNGHWLFQSFNERQVLEKGSPGRR